MKKGSEGTAAAIPKVGLTLNSDLPSMKAGEKVKIPVMVSSTGSFSSAVLGIKFDDKKLAVRSVLYGDVFGMNLANTAAAPFLNQGGKMFVSFTAADKTVAANEGVLAFIEIEALADGKPEIVLERDVLNFMAPDGKYLSVKF